MNINELIGVDSYGRDIASGKEISHKEKCNRAIEALGGMKNIRQFIPFTISQIQEALSKSDQYLNTLPMCDWERAAGFICRHSNAHFIGGGITYLYRAYGVNCFSPSDGVSILKEAARLWAEEENENNGKEVVLKDY